jgi:geranylgeranyl diphosphate synthase type II
LRALTDYAEEFGLAFQITDDILDVIGDAKTIGKPVGSDERNENQRMSRCCHCRKRRALAGQTAARAQQALESFGTEADFLRELVTYLVSRNK